MSDISDAAVPAVDRPHDSRLPHLGTTHGPVRWGPAARGDHGLALRLAPGPHPRALPRHPDRHGAGVSLTNWNGSANPFGGGQGAEFVGIKNYSDLFFKDGLTRANFMQSISNTFWYVIAVVPPRRSSRWRWPCWSTRSSSGPQLLPHRLTSRR